MKLSEAYPKDRSENVSLIRLKLGEKGLQKALYEGRLSEQGASLRMKEILLQNKKPVAVVFEEFDAEAAERPSLAMRLFQTTRAFSLTATLAPAIATLLYGIWMGYETFWYLPVLCVVGLVLLQVSVNVLNDVEDYLKLIDGPKLLGGSGALVKAWYTAKQLKGAGLLSLFLGLLSGAMALSHSPLVLTVFLVFGFLASYGYSSRGFRMKYIALGDLNVFVSCGPALSLGFAYACFQSFDLGVLILGLVFGFFSCAFLHINNMEDIELDRSRSALTLASLLGFQRSRYLLVVYYSLGFILIGWAAGGRILPLSYGVSQVFLLPMVFYILRRVFKASGPLSPDMQMLRMEGAKTLSLSGALALVGFGVAIFQA